MTPYEEYQWKKRKEYNHQYKVWVRGIDCLIAEKIFGYEWMKCNRKKDFAGNDFEYILATPPLNGACILEPDTRVRNYTSYLVDALQLVAKTGLIPPQFPFQATQEEIAMEICRYTIEKMELWPQYKDF